MAKDPRIAAIEAEADRRSRAPDSRGGAKSSPKERKGIRNELRAAQGLGYEKKKKGGFAGVVERNDWLLPALSLASSFIPGANLLAPIAVGAGGRAAAGGNFEDVLQGGLQGAALGGVGSLAKGAYGALTAPAAAGGVAPIAVGAGAAPVAAGTAGGIAPVAVGGGFGGALSKAGDWLTADGGRNALGVAQGLNAAYGMSKSRGLANKAVRGQEAEWKAGAPLREAGRAGLLAGVPGNPFAPVRVG